MTPLGIYSVNSFYARLSDHQTREKISRDRIISTQMPNAFILKETTKCMDIIRTIVPQTDGHHRLILLF